ncbi:MAG: hypothetical protein M1531_06665 [Chloroflexi bacterium]|nr:hypothetical protein [Chloroflexota bacterium]
MGRAMTGKERMLIAMRRGVPDRVPVCPDISMMVPSKLTGRPFWDIFLHKRPFVGDAYLDAIRYFGMDGWYIYDELRFGNARLFSRDGEMASLFPGGPMLPGEMLRIETVSVTEEAVAVRTTVETPLGPLTKVDTYFRADSPWPQEKWIKDIDRDWPRLQYLMGEEWSYTLDRPNYDRLGDLGVYALMVLLPLDFWFHIRDGASEQLTFDLVDRPDVMDEIFSCYSRFATALVQAYLEARPDEVHMQGSCSSLSLTSAALYKKHNLPFLKEITRQCKAGNLITHQHTCGKSALALQWNYEHTDLDVMEPLEGPPGGDVDLAEAKRRYGDKISLKGNLNTFQLMLRGTPEDVEGAAKAAIDAAASGGGYILSTGDQCGRDTPYENLFKLVEVAKTYGRYV